VALRRKVQKGMGREGRGGEEMLTDAKLLPNRLNRKPIGGGTWNLSGPGLPA